MADQELGKVTHFFGKAMVAVVKLDGDLAAGDTVKIVRGDSEFEMKVDSMQIEHQAIESGKAGDEVAIKVAEPTKEGAIVYKVVE